MGRTSFLKQAAEPLFADLLWSRPLVLRQAGRLLVMGGHSGSFSEVQSVYLSALAAGIGQCRIVVPDSLRRVVGDNPTVSWAPANPAGSLAKAALATILEEASEADAIVIGADLSHNSETTILIETLLDRLTKPLILFGGAIDALTFNVAKMTGVGRLLIVDTKQLLKLSAKLAIGFKVADNNVLAKTQLLGQVMDVTECDWLLSDQEIFVGARGQVSMTAINQPAGNSELAGVASAWWLQNQARPFAGLTTAAFILAEAANSISTSSTPAAMAVAVSRVINRY